MNKIGIGVSILKKYFVSYKGISGVLTTPALFKTYEGCEHYTDMEAVEIIISLEKLSAISNNLLHNSDPIIIDNQQVVYLNPLQEIKLQAA